MDIKTTLVAFALGVAVGIVTTVALSDPRLTVAFLIVCIVIIVAGGIAALRAKRRRQEAIEAFDTQSNVGSALRARAFSELLTLSPDEDKAYWWELLQQWDGDSHRIVHKYADQWHSRYNTSRVTSLFYTALPNQGRATTIDNLDARLTALAEIRPKL